MLMSLGLHTVLYHTSRNLCTQSLNRFVVYDCNTMAWIFGSMDFIGDNEPSSQKVEEDQDDDDDLLFFSIA